MHHPLLFMVPVVQTVLLSLLQKVAKKGKYKLISVPPMALVEGIGEEVRQETALGVLHALNVRDQAQGGAVAHAAPVSYTHLDVYKRQPLRWWQFSPSRPIWDSLHSTHGS